MSAQATILQLYGEPNEEYQSKHCILWKPLVEFPWLADVKNTATGHGVASVFINRDFKLRLQSAFADLERQCLHKEIKTWDGCFNQRSVRGRHSTSLHAWAMAVDLNAEIEKLWQNKTFWSDAFLNTMKKHRIFWGGDWTSRRDSMHFALFNG